MAGADYLNIAPGAKNGQRNGLSLLVDVDSFEYGDYPKVYLYLYLGKLRVIGHSNVIAQITIYKVLYILTVDTRY